MPGTLVEGNYEQIFLNMKRVKQDCWLRGSVVERQSSAGELFLSYARPVADG